MKKIAIIVFIPNKEYLIQQFFSLYYSVMLHPALRKEADFIIGCSAEINKLFNLENCVVVHSDEISLKAEYKFSYSDDEYGYINSWSHFLDQKSIDTILNYPYALRIDVDTFLSPNILSVDLGDKEILVGKGGYIGGDETKANLLRLSTELGLTHRHLHNLGSTWFTHSHIMIEVGQAALECARYIIHHEFTEEHGEWPRWYALVTTLYAGEIALNHSPYDINQTDKLDAESASEESIDDVFSVHAWHASDFYSKHEFMNGKYQERQHNYDMERLQDYAFLCAHSGKLLSDALRKAHAAMSVELRPVEAMPIEAMPIEAMPVKEEAPNLDAPLVLTPIQALRVSANLLKQALPQAPLYIVRRLKQKMFNRT